MKVLFAPSIPWLPQQKDHTDDQSPDARKFFRYLEAEGIESIIIDPNPRPWNPFAGKNPLLQSIDPIRALRISLLHRDIDVVVSVFEGAAASVGAMRRFLGVRAAIVLWDIGLTNWRLRHKIINFLLPKIDALFVIGKNQIEHIEKTYAPCQSITHVGHYVDTDFYVQEPLQMNGYILSVGEDIGRDYLTFINAVKSIDRPAKIKANNPRIDEKCPNIEIVRERLSYAGLRELYAKSSIVVMPSFKTDNASGVSTILEACASGRPLIVTDNPGIHDFIIPGKTCLVVPVQDANAMKNAIDQLLSDEELCFTLAANARQFVEEKCSTAAFARRFAHHLRLADAANKQKNKSAE